MISALRVESHVAFRVYVKTIDTASLFPLSPALSNKRRYPMNPQQSSRESWILATTIGMAAGMVLAGYEFIRSPSNTLFVEYYGKESLPTVMAVVPVAVIALVYLYGRLVSTFGPRRTLSITTIGCAITIVGGWLALRSGYKEAAPILYVFRSAYVVLLIEQYWSLINSSLSEYEAKRMNGPICGIASMGAIIGGLIGERATIEFGTANMVLIAGILTLPAVLLSSFAYRISVQKSDQLRAAQLERASHPKADHLGLRQLLQNRTLLLILGMVLMTQGLVTALGIMFQSHLSDAFTDIDQQTAYSFGFYAIINTVAGIGQFLVAPLLMIFVRNHYVQMLMPIAILVFVGAYFDNPGLETAGWVFIAFKAIDYSVFRASKEIYYIPMDFDARFRTKEVIDIFGYRLGKGAAGGLFDIIQRFGIKLTEASYGLWSIAFAVLWLGIAFFLRGPKAVEEPANQTHPQASIF
jgi:AAA family ATP:ADP antiporter